MNSRYYRIQRSPLLPRLGLLLMLLILLSAALAANLQPGSSHGMKRGGTVSLPVLPEEAPGTAADQQERVLFAEGESEDEHDNEEPVPSKLSPATPAGAEAYDYTKPVPAAETALTDEYFQDAVFIGDSRTGGLQKFSGPRDAAYFHSNGLKVDTIFTRQVVKTAGGQKVTVFDALRQKPFKKVYIMLGINELGWVYSDLFIKKYAEVIAEIQNIEPEAQIYLQSLLPVSKERSQKDEIFNNTNIGRYNELIKQMAAEKSLYYLDVARCVSDEEGNLYSEASTDGIHLNKKYCDLWMEYLRHHYVERDF